MIKTKLEELQEIGKAPLWMDEAGFQTLSSGYLNENETPYDMYRRLSYESARVLNKPELEEKFFDYISRGLICPASPVASNLGSKSRKAMPVSCFSIHPDDSLKGIFEANNELAALSAGGGGVGICLQEIRGTGAPISGGGVSDGVVPWCRGYETTVHNVSQNSVRRGSTCCYLPIESVDFYDFLNLRDHTGADLSRRCLTTNFHHAVVISDDFMESLEKDGYEENKKRWTSLLTTRVNLGEPFIMWKDNANKKLPQAYINNGLEVHTSNLCTEIFLHTSPDISFTCLLSSLNLSKWDEIKNSDCIEVAIWFLEGVMESFIQKAEGVWGYEKALRGAKAGRALGLGVLAFHTLLQSKNIVWGSFDCMRLSSEIGKTIKERAEKASREIAFEYGEPEWCKGTGMRHTHLLAFAPTVSNALISGTGLSQGIEPYVGCIYSHNTAKGSFLRKNQILLKILQEKGRDTFEVWNKISEDGGSVKSLDFLDEHTKEVFKTAREINQFDTIRIIGNLQRFVDQGISTNIFWSLHDKNDINLSKKAALKFHKLHMDAWRAGLKSLYYVRTENALKVKNIMNPSRDEFKDPNDSDSCRACEG